MLAAALLLQYRVGCDCGGTKLVPVLDAGAPEDAGSPDAGPADSGSPDAGPVDSGFDAGPPPACSDGIDNDNDGLVDFPDDVGCSSPSDNDEFNLSDCDAGAVEACGAALGVCTPGVRTCVNALWSGCDGGVRPAGETCNGRDDNCNGVTDEGIIEACTINSCAGVRVCIADAGTFDGGQYSACLPLNSTAETCNGVDDNCNGVVDEGIVETCVVFGCPGTRSCIAGGAGTFSACSPTTVTPETCNNVDDNCNGVVDEGLSRACYTGPAGTRGVGRCADGVEACSAGVWGPACPGQRIPTAEVCGNGIDEDCNGPANDVCDAGGCTTAGAWNVDGGPLTYTCALGLVNIDITQFVVSNAALSTLQPQPTWSPGATRPLKGPLFSCPAGAIDAGVVYAGGCTEQYDLKATVTGPNTFVGTFTMTYSGSCLDCVNQSINFQGWR